MAIQYAMNHNTIKNGTVNRGGMQCRGKAHESRGGSRGGGG